MPTFPYHSALSESRTLLLCGSTSARASRWKEQHHGTPFSCPPFCTTASYRNVRCSSYVVHRLPGSRGGKNKAMRQLSRVHLPASQRLIGSGTLDAYASSIHAYPLLAPRGRQEPRRETSFSDLPSVLQWLVRTSVAPAIHAHPLLTLRGRRNHLKARNIFLRSDFPCCNGSPGCRLLLLFTCAISAGKFTFTIHFITCSTLSGLPSRVFGPPLPIPTCVGRSRHRRIHRKTQQRSPVDCEREARVRKAEE